MSEHVAEPTIPVVYGNPNAPPAKRGERGKWVKGQSGNPKGIQRQHADLQQVKTAAASYTVEGIDVLAKIMRDRKAHANARVRAVEILLERGHGRAAVTVEIGADQALLNAIDGLGNAQLRLLAMAMQAGAQQAQHVIEVESQAVQELSHDADAEQGGMQEAK